jgi:hypothetical protein
VGFFTKKGRVTVKTYNSTEIEESSKQINEIMDTKQLQNGFIWLHASVEWMKLLFNGVKIM